MPEILSSLACEVVALIEGNNNRLLTEKPVSEEIDRGHNLIHKRREKELPCVYILLVERLDARIGEFRIFVIITYLDVSAIESANIDLLLVAFSIENDKDYSLYRIVYPNLWNIIGSHCIEYQRRWQRCRRK